MENSKFLMAFSKLNTRAIIYVTIGFVSGFSLASLYVLMKTATEINSPTERHHFEIPSSAVEEDLNHGHGGSGVDMGGIFLHSHVGVDSDTYAPGPLRDIGTHDHFSENNATAKKLFKEVRVLCWILTSPENHQSRAIHIKRTWGKRCNKLLFMSSKEDKNLGSIKLPAPEGYDSLWAKTKEAFKYVYTHHLNDADWFFKADDDTYAVMENMRYLLYPYSPETPIYFGCRFKPYIKQGYMSGGAGYVLSREAVRRFVEQAIPNMLQCRPDDGGAEDVEIGKCLESVRVRAGDSRDAFFRGRFFPFTPEHHLIPDHNKTGWYWDYIYYKTDEGLDCCSDNAITFHYISPNQMYVLDYLIYHLTPYGITHKTKRLPRKLNVRATKSRRL